MALVFWFEFASTYSYLSAMRIEGLAGARGVAVDWQPFLLGPIFRAQGWETSPFNLFPAKGRYMWRDLERQCAKYGIPFRRPRDFPRNGLLPARVACLGLGEPWLPAFARGVYAANFAEDRDIADPAVVAGALAAAGGPAELVERADRPEAKALLREATERARSLGLFGAPSFLAGGELFWGDDRLEDALACARGSAAAARPIGGG
jgi:2-hydroxychromene-2-carboxylate isomerase